MNSSKEAVMRFYTGALTVNETTNPEETLNEICSDDFVSKGSESLKTKETFVGELNHFWNLIPNMKWEPQEIINQGNTFAVRSIATGNPCGNFMGLLTDGSKSFNILTIDIHKVKDGKIFEVYHLEDWGTAMKQLKS
jgi:predicted ester cyclase